MGRVRTKRNRIPLLLFLIALLVIGAFCAREYLSSLYQDNVIPMAYEDLVFRYAEEYQVPPSLIYAVVKCESNFDPEAMSRAGAMGLMQLMPDTFSWLSKISGSHYDASQIKDPGANIHMGVYYLSWLYGRFESWDLCCAAYNAGQNRVKRWLEEGTLYSSDGSLQIPIRETAQYLERISHYRNQYLEHYNSLKEKEKAYE